MQIGVGKIWSSGMTQRAFSMSGSASSRRHRSKAGWIAGAVVSLCQLVSACVSVWQSKTGPVWFRTQLSQHIPTLAWAWPSDQISPVFLGKAGWANRWVEGQVQSLQVHARNLSMFYRLLCSPVRFLFNFILFQFQFLFCCFWRMAKEAHLLPA